MRKYISIAVLLHLMSCQEIAQKQEEIKDAAATVSRLDSMADAYLSDTEKKELMKSVSIDSIIKYKDNLKVVGKILQNNEGLVDSIKKSLSDPNNQNKFSLESVQKMLKEDKDVYSKVDSLVKKLEAEDQLP